MQKTSGNKVADHLAPAHGRALGAACRGRTDDARLSLTFHGKSHHRGRVRYRAPDYDAWTPQRLLIILRPGGDGQVGRAPAAEPGLSSRLPGRLGHAAGGRAL